MGALLAIAGRRVVHLREELSGQESRDRITRKVVARTVYRTVR